MIDDGIEDDDHGLHYWATYPIDDDDKPVCVVCEHAPCACDSAEPL
jgi:hypothetical protein